MTTGLPLFDLVEEVDERIAALVHGRTIQERFEIFHKAHPEVYALFKRFANELVDAGHRRGSARAIIHRVRWHTSVNPEHDFEGFKINDHFSSRYARKLIAERPEFWGPFFELRTLRTA